MRPVFRDENIIRTTLDPEILRDPEWAFDRLSTDTRALQRRAVHYDGYKFGAATFAADKQGYTKLLGGANYKPFRGSPARVCGEIALLLGAVDDQDKLGNVWALRSPQEWRKKIEHSREDQRTLHMCGPCRQTVSRLLLPSLTLVMFVGNDVLPSEVMQLGDMNFYHDNPDVPFPEERSKEEWREEAISALANFQFMPPLSRFKVEQVASRILPETLRQD